MSLEILCLTFLCPNFIDLEWIASIWRITSIYPCWSINLFIFTIILSQLFFFLNRFNFWCQFGLKWSIIWIFLFETSFASLGAFQRKIILNKKNLLTCNWNYFIYFKLMLWANYSSQTYEIWTYKMLNIIHEEKWFQISEMMCLRVKA